MRSNVRISGRLTAALLAPLLMVAGALQPDPVLPGPRPAAPSPFVAAASPGPSAAPAPPPTSGLTLPVALRAGAVEPPRVQERADRSRTAPATGLRRTPEQRGRAALESLRYDWRALGYQFVFRGQDRGTLGTANSRTRTITIYVRRAQSEQSLRATVAHELAHALDFEHGTNERRDAYRRLRGLPAGSTWFPCSHCDDRESPAGDFGEVFALWLAGPGDFRSRVKAAPTARELADLVPLFQLPRPAPSASPAPSAAEPEPEAEPAEGGSSLPAVLRPPPSPGPPDGPDRSV